MGFIGKCFCNGGLFVQNVNVNEFASSSFAYIVVEVVNLWHGHLGHTNVGYIKKITNLGLLPDFKINNLDKCETCVKSKFTN